MGFLPEDLIGEVVGGRYKVNRIIGRGGFGTIYEVSHQVLGRQFAMKTLSRDMRDASAAARFFREADSIAKLRHPNVVDIFGWEHLEDGSPCIVMEYLAGEDLSARIQREGAMSWSQIMQISDQVLSALEVAHNIGIIHRDLKPGNIFLAQDDARKETAKLLDFGLSKIREGAGHDTTDARVMGTPAYMAPEQAHGKHSEVGPHTDLWAMGAILFEMATGQVAFPGVSPIQVLYRICHGAPEPLKEMRGDAPLDFIEVVQRAMSRDPQRMFKDAPSMREALAMSLVDIITRPIAIMSPAALAAGTDPAADKPVDPYVTKRVGVAPPTGTITFLFTELLDTARLWEQHGEAMKDVIVRHDSVLREAMDFHQGHIFKTTGEGFWVAFANPKKAAAAAVAAQRMLHSAPWGVHSEIKVRMALHTGPAHERSGDYYGPTLNRIVRLLALAHGGQVIMSGATRELVADDVPDGTQLADLGVHPLRDLTRPEHVYQLSHADLPSSHDSLQIPRYAHNNLPSELSLFVGREEEVRAVRENLRRHRLVTVSGLGGCGKTRLALQVASQSFDDFPDGVWFVELASLTDGELVAQTLAEVLDLARDGIMAPAAPWVEKLVNHLSDKRALIVLDNCEHLIENCADLSENLLRKCSHLRILAATREPLGVEGEVSHRLGPLSVPSGKALEDIAATDSVRLFVERARLQQPAFILTRDNAAAVGQICNQLEGIPLAIELAAARLNVLSVENLAERLSDRLTVLTATRRSAAPRQKSLRATLDWSYELLSKKEQALLSRLAVFRGSFSLAATEEICAGNGVARYEVLDLLEQLTQKSLIRLVTGEGEPRYLLLDTVRQYADEKLAETGDDQAVRVHHRDWFLELAERAGPELKGPQQTMYLDLLEAELDNIRAAFHWAIEQDEGKGTLRFGAALHWFWVVRGDFTEGSRLIELAAATDHSASQSCQATALAAGGLLLIHLDADRAKVLLEKALEIGPENPKAAGLARYSLGYHALTMGNFADVTMHLTESCRLYESCGDHWGRAFAGAMLGCTLGVTGHVEAGETLCEQSVQTFKRLNDSLALAYALMSHGEIPRSLGNVERAAELYEQALILYRESGEAHGIILALVNSGIAQCMLGNVTIAELRLRETLLMSQGTALIEQMAQVCFAGLADVAIRRGDFSRAAQLIGASRSAQRTGKPLHPADDAYYRQVESVLFSKPGTAEWEKQANMGEGLSLREAIAFSLK